MLLDGCPLLDEVLLAVDELVVNALRHTKSGQPGGTFTVELTRWDGAVAVSVTDEGAPSEPVVTDAADDAESGRGLRTVSLMAVAGAGSATTGPAPSPPSSARPSARRREQPGPARVDHRASTVRDDRRHARRSVRPRPARRSERRRPRPAQCGVPAHRPDADAGDVRGADHRPHRPPVRTRPPWAPVCTACGINHCRTVRAVSDALAAYGLRSNPVDRAEAWRRADAWYARTAARPVPLSVESFDEGFIARPAQDAQGSVLIIDRDTGALTQWPPMDTDTLASEYHSYKRTTM